MEFEQILVEEEFTLKEMQINPFTNMNLLLSANTYSG